MRTAESNQGWLERKKQLEAAGLPADEVAGGAWTQEHRKRWNQEPGIVGGAALPSPADRPDPQQFASLDALKNPATFPGLASLNARPDNAPPVAGSPEIPTGGANGNGALQNAGKAAESANKQLEKAATNLQGLSSEAQAALGTFNIVVPQVAAVMQRFATELANLAARVDTVESSTGTQYVTDSFFESRLNRRLFLLPGTLTPSVRAITALCSPPYIADPTVSSASSSCASRKAASASSASFWKRPVPPRSRRGSAKVNEAMRDIEQHHPQLAAVLSKTCHVFTSTLLKELLKFTGRNKSLRTPIFPG